MKLWHWLCFLILLLEDHCSIQWSENEKGNDFLSHRYVKPPVLAFLQVIKTWHPLAALMWQLCHLKSNKRFLTDLLCAPLIQVCGLHIELETQLQSWIPQDPESQDSFSYMKGSKKAVQMMRMCNCMIPEEMWILFSKQAIFYSKNMNNTNCWL